MFIRICADIFLFLSILFLPWWCSLLFCIYAVFFFSSYYEVIAAGFLIDMLYGAPRVWSFGLSVAAGPLMAVLYLFAQWIKIRVRPQ